MDLQLSAFGRKFTSHSGILQLMDDLGKALAAGGDDVLMLGGGNPGHLPGVQIELRRRMEAILARPANLNVWSATTIRLPANRVSLSPSRNFSASPAVGMWSRRISR